MAISAQDLVGCQAYSREGDKLGKVNKVIRDPEASSDCLVIKQGMFRDLVVPVDIVEMEGISVTVPFAHTVLNDAPRVAKKGELSRDERARLEQFYHATS